MQEMFGAIRSSRLSTWIRMCRFSITGTAYKVKLLIFNGSLEDSLRKVLAQCNNLQ
jgi:hypothetical protein